MTTRMAPSRLCDGGMIGVGTIKKKGVAANHATATPFEKLPRLGSLSASLQGLTLHLFSKSKQMRSIAN